MGPRALAAWSGLAPWSRTGYGHLVKKLIQNRGSRGHAPLGCLPLWGREGVTLANSTEWIIQMISPEHFSYSQVVFGSPHFTSGECSPR